MRAWLAAAVISPDEVPRLAALIVVTLLASAAPASAQLYRWTDGDGVPHYTNSLESVPAAHRLSARELAAPSVRGESADQPDDAAVIAFSVGAPIIVTAHLNGVPLRLLVDTGAARTLIAPAALARAGFPSDGGRPIRIVGVTGTAGAREVTVPLLEVADARIGPLTVVAHAVATIESRGAALSGGATLDGLLGRDVLQFFTLAVDAAAGQAVLRPR
jgi:predicted aspartyl protease